MHFEEFPETSRVWIYCANRFLSESEVNFCNNAMQRFIHNWSAHGKPIYGGACVLHSAFLVLVADESKGTASGCSIDSSVHFVKEIGNELQINFFNRLSVIIQKGDEIKHVHYNELAEYSDWKMYDLTVATLKDLRESWLVPIAH